MSATEPAGLWRVGVMLLLVLLVSLTASGCARAEPQATATPELIVERREAIPTAGEDAARRPDDRYPSGEAPVEPTAYLSRPAKADDAHNLYLPLVHNRPRWAPCSRSGFGTMLIHTSQDDWITATDVMIYANDQLEIRGLVGTGAPSDLVRDEWFGKLPGWTRLFMRGTYDALQTVHPGALVFGMAGMYECLAYGPESAHQAGQEALDPAHWVPRAEALAQAAGKCLVYAPAVRDYEFLSTPEGEDAPQDELLAQLIAQVAPHVDIWVIQLGKYQLWVDAGLDDLGNPYTMDDFRNWVARWTSWIKTSNPETRVWTQLGIGRRDPIEQICLPPQSPEYILQFREVLASAGVDGVWVMPAQPCQPCPPSPPPGFPCSTDPQDHEYYRQSLAVFQQAMELACTG